MNAFIARNVSDADQVTKAELKFSVLCVKNNDLVFVQDCYKKIEQHCSTACASLSCNINHTGPPHKYIPSQKALKNAKSAAFVYNTSLADAETPLMNKTLFLIHSLTHPITSIYFYDHPPQPIVSIAGSISQNHS